MARISIEINVKRGYFYNAICWLFVSRIILRKNSENSLSTAYTLSLSSGKPSLRGKIKKSKHKRLFTGYTNTRPEIARVSVRALRKEKNKVDFHA